MQREKAAPSRLESGAAVRDHQAGRISAGEDPFPQVVFGLHIERARQVVEDQQRGLAREHAGGGSALLPVQEEETAIGNEDMQVWQGLSLLSPSIFAQAHSVG